MARHRPQRVIAYIDGFNLYFGLRDSGLRRHYWLNLKALAQNLCKPDQRLVMTKYFTARISGGREGDPPDLVARWEEKRKRQGLYLEALSTLADFQVFEGHYLGKTVTCYRCQGAWRTHEEKMTDVCIATEMLTDGFSDGYDTALLISGDSDLVPPIRAVRRLFPAKRVVVAFPPNRVSEQLRQVAHAWFVIGDGRLRASHFPDRVVKPNGFALRRPPDWR